MSGPPHGRVSDPAALPTYPLGANNYAPLSVDQNGRLLISASGSSIVVVGAQTPGDAVANPSDCLDTRDFVEAWDVTDEVWKRLVSLDINAVGPPIAGVAQCLQTYSIGGTYDFTAADWGFLSTVVPSDALANPIALYGGLQSTAYNMMWTAGASQWRRQTGIAPGDSVANPAGALETQAYGARWDADSSVWRRAEGNANGATRTVVDAPAAATSEGCASSYYYGDPSNTDETANIKASAGKLLAFACVASNAAAPFYFCLVNKASAAVNGDPIVWCCRIDTTVAGSPLSQAFLGRKWFGDSGFFCSAGITWALSSTPDNVTLLTGADTPSELAVQAMFV